MNSCSFIVKIISPLEQIIITNDIYVVKAKVQFAKLRKKKSFDQFEIVVWGKLGKEFLKYYKHGDYIIVQGIISFKRIKVKNRFQKETKMTVKKLYPFLLAN